MALKMAARKNTLKDLLSVGTTGYDESQMMDYRLDDTPPVSDVSVSSPEHSLPSSPDFKDAESDDESLGITKGMLDHTRMALCMFMLAVITFNPFGLALNKLDGTEKGYSDKFEGRTLFGCKFFKLAYVSNVMSALHNNAFT